MGQPDSLSPTEGLPGREEGRNDDRLRQDIQRQFTSKRAGRQAL